MNAAELIGSVARLPGARRLAAAEPILASVEVAGIEVATSAAVDEAAMRRVWRARHRGATPLLLVADRMVHETVAVLGPADGGGTVRDIEVAALEHLLRRVSSMARLEAVRDLAGELERLDQAGMPGVRLRDLLTMHTLDTRLRRDATRWGQAEEVIAPLNGARDWRAIMTAFGYEIERRPLRGYLLRSQGRPVAVVHPKGDASELARLDAEGRPPEGSLRNDAESENVAFGLLTTGARFRLFNFAMPAGATSRYLDLDAAVLRADDRPLLALLSPTYLAEGGFGSLVSEANAFGSALRKRLDEGIRQRAFPALARGLERWADENHVDLRSEVELAELEKAALTLVFRLLFLLYAESSSYLPMDNRSYQQASLTSLIGEATETQERLGRRSTSLWDRTQVLVRSMRSGNPAWRVPPYNGALFAQDGFDGAETLERLSMTDPDFAEVLIALGRDPETSTGVDFSTLEIGHVGHIYEALLSMRLSLAPRDLVYDSRQDRFRPVLPGEQAGVMQGSLLWITNEGGRKSGGVYYTRSELVRHLVSQAVLPAFERHLEEVMAKAETDPAAASQHLLSFAVVDPACGSGHFLVEVVSAVADRLVSFLADHPLPGIAEAIGRLRAGALAGSAIDDAVLVRRLVLKHCVYGVDVSPMGAEVAKLSLWLASFVPGLSLAYLDGNLKVGNSLVGVVETSAVGASKYVPLEWNARLQQAAAAAARGADIDDRNPDEVRDSERAGADARDATKTVESIFNLWCAEAFGVVGARDQVNAYANEIIAGRTESKRQVEADAAASENGFLHWPIAFPRVFARERPGFDAVVGNPPWEEVTVEELAFYARFAPGLRGLTAADRDPALARLLSDRPELLGRLKEEQERLVRQRRYLAGGEYESMAGDPDLYKFFCQRYKGLLRNAGALGVVLPRSAFMADGSTGFREWLITRTTCRRVDFLLNTGRWAFDSEPRYTIALLATEASPPEPDHRLRVAGVARSEQEWVVQSEGEGVMLAQTALGPGRMVPLLRDDREADLLARMRRGDPFPLGPGGRWRCFGVAELHETNDRRFWAGAKAGQPLWKGASFDQFQPNGGESGLCPLTDEVRRKTQKPRPGADSLVAKGTSQDQRRAAVMRELTRARVAFRDVSRATDSRTVRACLIPKGVLLTNTAPYLCFLDGNEMTQAACLAVLNSLPFDWQARRFVETHLNFFMLEGLRLPPMEDDDFAVVADAAMKLSCQDDRFNDFADAAGVAVCDLRPDEGERLRVEIDARVSRAWGLSSDDMGVIFRDFTDAAVSAGYRARLLARLAEL